MKNVLNDEWIKIINKIHIQIPIHINKNLKDAESKKKNPRKVKSKFIQESRRTKVEGNYERRTELNTFERDSDPSLEIFDLSEDGDDLQLMSFNKSAVCKVFGVEEKVWHRCVQCCYWAHAKCSIWDIAAFQACFSLRTGQMCRQKTECL